MKWQNLTNQDNITRYLNRVIKAKPCLPSFLTTIMKIQEENKMAKLNEIYKALDTVGATGDFEPLPSGWYSATITNASLEDTRAGTGQYIKCRYDITGPTHEGRVIFSNINIRNPNPKAEEIARQQLSSLILSIGRESLTDTDELIGATLQIKVSVKPSDGRYEASNEVKGFRSRAETETEPRRPAHKQSTNEASPPWAR